MKLSVPILLNAYSQGMFPMADDDGRIYWYDPDPRAIIPLDTFHVSKRLRRVIRNSGFEIRISSDFRGVMLACADPAPDRPTTWINDEILDVYCAMHRVGFAESVETWRDGKLVGGLYGVCINGLFAGESMFSRETNASKVALVHLVERMRAGGFVLLDTQFITSHLATFGAAEIPRREYKSRLRQALKADATFFPEGFL